MFVVLIVLAVIAAAIVIGVRLALAGRAGGHEPQPVAVDATVDGAAHAPKPNGTRDPLQR